MCVCLCVCEYNILCMFDVCLIGSVPAGEDLFPC